MIYPQKSLTIAHVHVASLLCGVISIEEALDPLPAPPARPSPALYCRTSTVHAAPSSWSTSNSVSGSPSLPVAFFSLPEPNTRAGGRPVVRLLLLLRKRQIFQLSLLRIHPCSLVCMRVNSAASCSASSGATVPFMSVLGGIRCVCFCGEAELTPYVDEEIIWWI